MPIYEYACDQCGHQFEKLMRMGADAPDCPECGASQVRKRVSQSGFILKGGGWYKDHYGLKGSDKSESKSDASKSSDSSKSTSDTSSSGSSSSGSSSSSGGTSAVRLRVAPHQVRRALQALQAPTLRPRSDREGHRWARPGA